VERHFRASGPIAIAEVRGNTTAVTVDSAPPTSTATYVRVAKLTALGAVSFFLFVLGLQLIKCGARPLTFWFKPEGTSTVRGALGAGWLLACVVLSGSPVAGISLSLLDKGDLNAAESFGMITGSRLGASFVVLVVGFLYDLRAHKERGGVYVGALALITTAVTYVPAFFLGYYALEHGWFDRLRFGLPEQVVSVVDLLIKPVVDLTGHFLPTWGQSVLGVLVLVGAFKLFDGFLPVVDPTGGKLSKMATTIYRPWITFLFGMLVTSFTLSVSVSLTVLVPLTARGLVRRENLIPYIMGANITTFIDTLVASLLINNRAGFTVVLCEMATVTAISLPIILLFYRPYERFVDGLARGVTKNRWRLAAFVVALFLVPLMLIWFQ
jgi:sodium-dependent phosphate cotransporter